MSFLFPLSLVCFEICLYMSVDMYLPALPGMAKALNTTETLAQATLTCWFLGTGVLQLILGPLSDSQGRRPVLLLGGLGFIVSTAICAITQDIYLFLLVRFLQGSTISSVYIAGYACIHERYDHKKAIKIIALMNSIVVLAPALGPLIGSLILTVGDWRDIFWVMAASASVTLGVLYFVMPETVEKQKLSAFSAPKLAQSYKNIIQNNKFCLYTLGCCLGLAGMIAWITAGPFLVIKSFNHTSFWFSIYQAAIFSGNIAATRLVGLLLNYIKTKTLTFLGLYIALLGSGSSFVCGLMWPQILPLFIACMTIFSIGFGLSFASMQRLAIESSQEPMGVKMAVYSTAMSLFCVLGSAFINLIYNGTILSLSSLLLVCACFAVLSCFFAERTSAFQQDAKEATT